jgi:hypothetical protein
MPKDKRQNKPLNNHLDYVVVLPIRLYAIHKPLPLLCEIIQINHTHRRREERGGGCPMPERGFAVSRLKFCHPNENAHSYNTHGHWGSSSPKEMMRSRDDPYYTP